jgi:glutamate---cysteine ligase / carboxylate-amine ligase
VILRETALMSVRTMGVEEELLLVDRERGVVRSVSQAALAAHRDRVGGRADDQAGVGPDAGMDHELFLQQLETGTAPCRTAAELAEDLGRCRREAAASAAAAGAALVAVGTAVLAEEEGAVTPKPRYQRIVEEFGEIGRQGSVCGMHVHVDVADDEEGVRVIDRLRPWLPVLRAMSVNSPYFHGRDTGYASWRSQVWGRWPSAGPSDPFGDAAGYRALTRALIASGAAIDVGMLYFDARLSQSYPTVEVRVFDSMTEPDDVVLLAVLTRALVTTLAAEPSKRAPHVDPWRPELLRAAHWKASRDGLSRDLLDPGAAGLRPARAVVESLVARVRPALEETRDLDVVEAGVEALLARGTGAARQRAAYERGGLTEVVSDLRDRFTASVT